MKKIFLAALLAACVLFASGAYAAGFSFEADALDATPDALEPVGQIGAAGALEPVGQTDAADAGESVMVAVPGNMLKGKSVADLEIKLVKSETTGEWSVANNGVKVKANMINGVLTVAALVFFSLALIALASGFILKILAK